jgi:hypothetical protein
MIQTIIEWASDPTAKAVLGTLGALATVVGGIWTVQKFARGKDTDSKIDQTDANNESRFNKLAALITLRVEKDDGSIVSYEALEINEITIAMQHKKYVFPDTPEVTLEYIFLNALGPLTYRIDLSDETQAINLAKRFAYALGDKFVGSIENVEAANYKNSNGSNMAIRALMDQVRAELLALNLVFVTRPVNPGGAQYVSSGPTNLGKAVFSTLLKRAAIKKSLPTAIQA